MNPVHSSLTPFCDEPGHFHAMTFLLTRPSYCSVRRGQVNEARRKSCPKDTVERMDRGDCRRDCGATSSNDRKFPSTARRRSIRARAARGASAFSAGGEPWFPSGAAVHQLRRVCSHPHESPPPDWFHGHVWTPAVRSV